MNFSKPILICDENEEFRNLLREMLIKNGFFHIVEVTSSSEAINILREKKEYFALIHSQCLSSEIMAALSGKKSFLVFASYDEFKTVQIATRLGVAHVVSPPFQSRKLLEKINSLI